MLKACTALVLCLALSTFTLPAMASDHHGHSDQGAKWEGAGIAVGAIMVLHYHNGAIPKAVAKVTKKTAKKIAGAMRAPKKK